MSKKSVTFQTDTVVNSIKDKDVGQLKFKIGPMSSHKTDQLLKTVKHESDIVSENPQSDATDANNEDKFKEIQEQEKAELQASLNELNPFFLTNLGFNKTTQEQLQLSFNLAKELNSITSNINNRDNQAIGEKQIDRVEWLTVWFKALLEHSHNVKIFGFTQAREIELQTLMTVNELDLDALLWQEIQRAVDEDEERVSKKLQQQIKAYQKYISNIRV